MFTDDWNKLTADERFAARLDAWQNTPIEFASPEVAAAYRDRVQLWRDAIALKKPARVPITPWIGLFPLRYCGLHRPRRLLRLRQARRRPGTSTTPTSGPTRSP